VKDVRIFTLEDAQATLPLVRRIVEELTEQFASWRLAVADYELLAGEAATEEGETPEQVAGRERVHEHAEAVSRCLGELEGVGCLFKGFEEGLVDFYTLRDDRLVLLCWHLGEDAITHWHDVDAGYAGRQPIDDLILSGTAP
jgi:hypothetical protein